MCYFLEYIWIFFFRFLFFFVLFFIFIEKKVPSPQRERRSQVFRRVEKRGMRRGERMKGGNNGEEEEGGQGGLEYLSLFSLSLLLSSWCVSLAYECYA